MAQTQTISETYERLHSGSARLYEDSLKTFPSGVTHDVRYLQPFPLFIDRTLDSRKWDVDGNEYIDYVMGHGALLLGHAHPKITEAVIEQAQKGTHYGGNSRLELEWGNLVREIVPSADEVRFTSSGTEATLMALRLARAYTGRDRILKFDQHFHGWHDYVVGTRAPESDSPHSAGVPPATSGTVVSLPQGDIGAVEQKLAHGDIAAVILEPTGASWGTMPLGSEFLGELRDACSKHNAVLIFDEVVTGFRVSPGGVQAHCEVTPDLTTMAKVLAGGLPGGAVAGKADIISMMEFRNDQAWNAEKRVQHPGTFNANPLSAAAGSAMLKVIRTAEPHTRANALNENLVRGMNGVLEQSGVAGSVYGLASYFHVTLGKEAPRPSEGIEWPEVAVAPPRLSGALIMPLKRAMINEGVDLMGGAGGFVSGVHSEGDIERTIAAFAAALAALRGEGSL